MSGVERPGAAAGGGAPGVCQLLREQLVEVVSSIRSHVVVMHGLALDGAGDRPVTGASAEGPDGGGLLVLAEDQSSR
ncbi:hypothetical protein [Streptomyces mirabilis]|uniref:hypothetical protein n=1 Tax=Streptomyces mirabilis TaxID=68239 RepID=UPI00225BA793|nr:hypothetical protein [Streptomyces mirabilis]MCX4425959.1 hypothetical protein [Streptomyces mirabilis]